MLFGMCFPRWIPPTCALHRCMVARARGAVSDCRATLFCRSGGAHVLLAEATHCGITQHNVK
jgi:hypothetical protein